MAQYSYNYQNIIRFNTPVERQYFKLRCLPCEQPFQHIVSENLMFPNVCLEHGTDAFGNRIQYGYTLEPHDMFVYTASGTVEQSLYRIPCPAAEVQPIYRLPSRFTTPSQELIDFARKFGPAEEPAFSSAKTGPAEAAQQRPITPAEEVHQTALALADAVYRHMSYTPGSTDNATTAAQAFDKGGGVCQDYTHIFLTLCKLHGIPARYVNGFMTGIGLTHAWAEIHDGQAWIAIDPTNNALITQGYIKIAHGRDAADCPVNRGIIIGNALQTTEIRVLTEEIRTEQQ